MPKSFSKIAMAIILLGLSSLGSAHGGGGSGSTSEDAIDSWTCRASVKGDEDGMFWLGVGQTPAEARIEALDDCQYFSGGQACYITCEPTF